MDDEIVERAEVPAHNKECASCLVKSLDAQNQRRALQVLADGQKKLQTTIESIAVTINGFDSRIEALEISKKNADIEREVNRKWINRITAVAIASGGGIGVILKILWDHVMLGK